MLADDCILGWLLVVTTLTRDDLGELLALGDLVTLLDEPCSHDTIAIAGQKYGHMSAAYLLFVCHIRCGG